MLRRIEDYTGSFISETDCDEQQGIVWVWGGQGSLARVVDLGYFVWVHFRFGHHF